MREREGMTLYIVGDERRERRVEMKEKEGVWMQLPTFDN